MEVAGDLGLGARQRLVAQGERSELHLLEHLAADALGQDPVVVARHPDPVAAALHARQRRPLLVAETLRAADVVEAVAQGDHRAGAVSLHRVRERDQRLAGVVGRQHHAAPGEGRALLEMEVGHQQRIVRGQDHRPRQVEERQLPGQLDLVRCLFVLAQCRHAKASSRSAASASARISSALSL